MKDIGFECRLHFIIHSALVFAALLLIDIEETMMLHHRIYKCLTEWTLRFKWQHLHKLSFHDDSASRPMPSISSESLDLHSLFQDIIWNEPGNHFKGITIIWVFANPLSFQNINIEIISDLIGKSSIFNFQNQFEHQFMLLSRRISFLKMNCIQMMRELIFTESPLVKIIGWLRRQFLKSWLSLH